MVLQFSNLIFILLVQNLTILMEVSVWHVFKYLNKIYLFNKPRINKV